MHFTRFFFLLTLSLLSLIANAQQFDKDKIANYLQNQQFEEAIHYLNTIYKDDSCNLQLIGWLGYSHYMNENYNRSENYYRKLFQYDSLNVAANQYLSNIYISTRRFDDALTFVLRLKHLFPSSSVYARTAGSIYKKKGDSDSARFFFSVAYALAPQDKRNITLFAESLIRDSSYCKADSILNAGLRLDSFNVDFLKLLFESAYQSKNYQGLIEPAEKIMSWGELSVPMLTKLVFAYFVLERYEDCIRTCNYMDSNMLAGETVYYYAAKSWSKLKNPDRSNILLQKCLTYSISRTSELYYYSLGQNYEFLRKYTSAISCYDTAYYLFKNPSMLLYAATIFDEKLGNRKKAKSYYLRYLREVKTPVGEARKYYEYIRQRSMQL